MPTLNFIHAVSKCMSTLNFVHAVSKTDVFFFNVDPTQLIQKQSQDVQLELFNTITRLRMSSLNYSTPSHVSGCPAWIIQHHHTSQDVQLELLNHHISFSLVLKWMRKWSNHGMLFAQLVTGLPTPKYFCQYSEQPMSLFSDFWLDFLQLHHQSVRTNIFKGQFFYHLSCKNSVWTHIFNYTDPLHSDYFILYTSVKVVLDWRPQNIFSRSNAPCVLLSLMPTCPFLNIFCLVGVCFLGFVQSSSSSSVSCSHLSQQLWIQTRNVGKWLTSVKFDAKLMFIGITNFFDKTGLAVYFSPGNGFKYANVNES